MLRIVFASAIAMTTFGGPWGEQSLPEPSLSEIDLTRQVVVADRELIPDFDRRKLLERLFRSVTNSARSDEERVKAFVYFLQDYFFHPEYAPQDAQGQAVYDPAWLLTHRIGQCGQVNRLLVDSLIAGGFQARLIQLNGHVGAEVFYDKGWHYIDADSLSYHYLIENSDGKIPSAVEIYKHHRMVPAELVTGAKIDSYPNEILIKWPGQKHEPYAKVFEPWRDDTTGLSIPFAYVKTATPEQERNKYFGWNYYRAQRLTVHSLG